MERPTASDRLEELLAHRAWVQRVARALVVDESRADDLEQETWIRALRSPPPRPSRAWLGTVLRNAASSMRIAERRREAHETSAPPPQSRPSPEQLLERAEVVERVARAVRTLEEPFRTVILLRYFEDLSPPDIAAQLEVPLETVRTRLRRALAQLRERLDQEHRGDRRAWALLLLPLARRHEPAATGSALAAGVMGVILMSLKAKAMIAGVVLLLVAGALWWPGTGAPSNVTKGASTRRGTAPDPGAASQPPSTARPPTAGDPAGGVHVAGPPAAPPLEADLVVRVLGPGGKPLPGAVILATKAPGQSQVAEGKTGDDGLFRIPGLRKESCRLEVRAAGFVRKRTWVEGSKLPGGPVEMRLLRGGAVTGRVVDEAKGAPVEGARVIAFDDDVRGATWDDPYAEAFTDGVGRFRAEGVLRDVPIFLVVTAHDFEEGRRRTVVDSAGGSQGEVEVRLRPGGAVEGVVRDGTGNPVAGALVLVATLEDSNLLEDPGIGSGDSEGPRRAFRAHSAKDGAFEVTGIPLGKPLGLRAFGPDGRRSELEEDLLLTAASPRLHKDARLEQHTVLRLKILAPDGSPAPRAFVDFPPGQDRFPVQATGPGALQARITEPGEIPLVVGSPGLASQARRIRVDEGQSLDLEFRLERGVAIEGVLVDDRGEAVSAADLEFRLEDVSYEEREIRDPCARADGQGRFRIEGLRPGSYSVCYRKGEDFRDLEGLLLRAPSEGVHVVVGRRASARVRLRLPEGASPPEVMDVYHYILRENGRTGSGDHFEWKDGVVRWSDIAPVETLFEVRPRGFLPLQWKVRVEPGASLDFGEVTLDPGLALEGRVVDVAGAPMRGVTVEQEVELGCEGASAATGEDGRFTLRPLPRAEVVLRVQREDYLDEVLRVVLPSTASPTVVMQRGGRICARVVGTDGRPAPGVLVRVVPSGPVAAGTDDKGGEQETDSSGTVAFLLRRGKWRLLAGDLREEPRGALEVEVRDGEASEATLRLSM